MKVQVNPALKITRFTEASGKSYEPGTVYELDADEYARLRHENIDGVPVFVEDGAKASTKPGRDDNE